MRKKSSMKNKGFTLVEIMVAIAISSVVLLMLSVMLVQGTKLFKRETEGIDVQNELQIVRNQLNECLMSAKSLVIVEAGDSLVIYTGEADPATNKLVAETSGTGGANEITTERVITFDSSEGKLYISNNYENATTEGNMISSYVKDVDIEINSDCMRSTEVYEHTEYYYVNPLTVNLDVIVESGDRKADSNITVRMRNILRNVTIYKSDSLNVLLANIPDCKSYSVK